jgi:bla regulator protein BlaR1
MEYFIKASALLTLFFLFYKLLLQKETFFQLNRIFLLGGLIISVVLPLILIPIYVEMPTTNLTNVEFSTVATATVTETSFDWTQIITFGYFAGIILFSSKLLISIFSLLKLILKSSKVRKSEGINFIETNSTNSPFSIFNTIVYNPNTFTRDELQQIIAHEKIHVQQKHSIDIFITEIVNIVFWFNPFIWFYKKELHQNLEYIADSNSIEQHKSSMDYQHLLLKTCFPNYEFSLTNKFYNSLIKKRITMLHTKESRNMNQLKTLLIIPILSLFLFAFNTKNIIKTSQKQVQLLTEELIIKGTVTDTNNNPIKGGLVLNGTKSGVSTNKEGVYAIKIQKGDVLTFSYKGMISQKITVTNDSQINVTLKKDSNLTEEIIEAKVPVNQSKKPLIVIDGKISSLTIEDLDENNIYSMSVIKGKTAQDKYGDKGDDGVIEITTKKE